MSEPHRSDVRLEETAPIDDDQRTLWAISVLTEVSNNGTNLTFMRTAPLDFESPIEAISSFDAGFYDRLVADVRKKHAEREAAKAKVIEGARTLEEAVYQLLRQLPELELRGVAADQRRLASAERMLRDGVAPSNANALVEEFKRNTKIATECHRAVNKLATALHKPMAKIDSKAALTVRRALLDLANQCKRLQTHYGLLMTQAEKLAKASEAPPDGPVKRAESLYKAAFAGIEGIHSIGAVYPDAEDTLPVYEMAVAIDPKVLHDRRRLREIEREIDDFVEQRDPICLGAIVLRFEPAAGAA